MKTVVKIPLKKDIQVLVEEGRIIEKDEVLARSSKSQEQVVINLSQILKVKASDIHKYLLRRPTDTVRQGEVVAQKRSILTTLSVRSPLDAKISEVNLKTGEVLLRVGSVSSVENITIPVSGKIKKIGKESIEIEVTGHKIAAVSGRGREVTGRLMHVTSDQDSIFNIDAEVFDRIVLTEKGTALKLAKLDTLGATAVIAKYVSKNYNFPSLTVNDEGYKELIKQEGKTVWIRPAESEVIVIGD